MLSWLMRGFRTSVAKKPGPLPEPPPLRSLEDLDALIDRCGLAPARDLIRSRARPCLHLIAGPGAPDAPLGFTRLGGAPDLAAGTAWPASEHGACSFLAQFDLADVAARAGPTDLPSEGLLSFFVDFIDGAANPVPVRAVLTPAGLPLVRLDRPARDEDYGAYTGWLKPVSVAAFVPGLDVQYLGFRFREEIEALAPDGDIDALEDAVAGRPKGSVGRLFGHADDEDGTDLRHAVHARRIGRPGLERYEFIRDRAEWEALKAGSPRSQGGPSGTPWTDAQDSDVRFMLENRPAIEAEVERLRLLLTLDSNRPMDLSINDADPIHLFIPGANLTQGDFGVLYGAVTQS